MHIPELWASCITVSHKSSIPLPSSSALQTVTDVQWSTLDAVKCSVRCMRPRAAVVWNMGKGTSQIINADHRKSMPVLEPWFTHFLISNSNLHKCGLHQIVFSLADTIVNNHQLMPETSKINYQLCRTMWHPTKVDFCPFGYCYTWILDGPALRVITAVLPSLSSIFCLPLSHLSLQVWRGR